MCNETLTVEKLKELLYLDEATGTFYWKYLVRKGMKITDDAALAGSDNGRGTTIIQIEGVNYRAHRLVWLYMTGALPDRPIYHINRLNFDNRFENLTTNRSEVGPRRSFGDWNYDAPWRG